MSYSAAFPKTNPKKKKKRNPTKPKDKAPADRMSVLFLANFRIGPYLCTYSYYHSAVEMCFMIHKVYEDTVYFKAVDERGEINSGLFSSVMMMMIIIS